MTSHTPHPMSTDEHAWTCIERVIDTLDIAPDAPYTEITFYVSRNDGISSMTIVRSGDTGDDNESPSSQRRFVTTIILGARRRHIIEPGDTQRFGYIHQSVFDSIMVPLRGAQRPPQ